MKIASHNHATGADQSSLFELRHGGIMIAVFRKGPAWLEFIRAAAHRLSLLSPQKKPLVLDTL